MQWGRIRVGIPALSLRWTMLILVLWGLWVVFVDFGAYVESRAVVPLVHTPEFCKPWQAPEPTQVAVQVPPQTELRVRNMHYEAQYTCYEVETPDGVRGWLPWDESYLRDRGLFVRWHHF